MAVSDDRKYTKAFVYSLLEGVKGKTLGEVDKSHQFARTEKSEKITGIAGDAMYSATIDNHNTFQETLLRNTSCNVYLWNAQTFSFLSHRPSSGLNLENHQLKTDYIHVRCLGHSSKLRASALS